MNKTVFLASAAALCIFASCQKEQAPAQPSVTEFTAAISTVKTTVDPQAGIISWTMGDEITITDGASVSSKFSVTGIDAQGKATFTLVSGQKALGAGPYTAVYGTDPAEEQTYSATAPSLPMSAESTTTDLTFTASCGLLELSVTAADGETCKDVNRIIVKGKPSDTGKYPGDTKGDSYFILDCSPAQSISATKIFYIVLPAGNYTNVGMTNTNGLGEVVTPPGGSVNIGVNEIEPAIVSGKLFSYPVDIKCKKYQTVTINNVIWMKENFACDKYDTESEVYTEDPDNYFLNHNYVIPQPRATTATVKDTLKTPYYIDATDRDTWSKRTAAKKQQTALSDEQVAKMGYSYNWAAAVGVATDLLRTTQFTGDRQGICPNGWHVPSNVEIEALRSYVESIKGSNTEGYHLKSTSGWYNAGNPTKYPQGADSYGFDLLPAGFAAGDSLSNVGAAGHVLTASPSATRSYKFCYSNATYTNGKFVYGDGAPKCNGRSLRCIKND